MDDENNEKDKNEENILNEKLENDNKNEIINEKENNPFNIYLIRIII